MALFTFSFSSINYKSSSGFMLPQGAEAVTPEMLPMGNIDQATCVLIADVDETQFPGEVRYQFVDATVVFHTLNPQELFIPIVSYAAGAGGEQQRFFLYDMSSHAKVLRVHHLPGGRWVESAPFAVFPDATNHIRITFDMPQVKGVRYKLNIGVIDTLTGASIDCDPLVGNDPP